MITIDKDQVTVQFAEKLDDPKIIIGNEGNKLTLHNYNGESGEIAVGEIVIGGDYNQIPSVNLLFHTIESIELVEYHLKSIKRRMNHPRGHNAECA